LSFSRETWSLTVSALKIGEIWAFSDGAGANIDAAFNKLPEKSRCVLFQRMLTIVYLAQDAQQT
jgi:hypothetical protein